MIKRALMVIAFVGIASWGGQASTAPASAQEWHCYDSYYLMDGTCPEFCPYGWDLCPCYTCKRIT